VGNPEISFSLIVNKLSYSTELKYLPYSTELGKWYVLINDFGLVFYINQSIPTGVFVLQVLTMLYWRK